jgi:PAS domain S-box-containing protein
MKVLSLKRRPSDSSTGQLEHKRLEGLINSMADGVIAVDKLLRIDVYNGAALNILDLNSTMQGKTLDKVFNPITRNGNHVDVNQYIRNVKVPKVDRDLRLEYSDGSIININLSVTPIYQGFARGGQDGFVLVLRDISHEKSLEEERDEFISVVSHELRTPIAITEGNISNAQYAARKTQSDAEVLKELEIAHKQILYLASMMNDLAMLSRADRGKLSVEVEKIDVGELMSNLLLDYKSEAERNRLKFVGKYLDNLGPLTSSRLYIREILQNFLTNAFKYTHQGSVTLSAEARDNGFLFAVKDTGIGISHADQEKIFNKFFRSEDYRTRSTGGTGLGLYVTKKLATLLHANISVESKLDQGSTFSIYVPNLDLGK